MPHILSPQPALLLSPPMGAHFDFDDVEWANNVPLRRSERPILCVNPQMRLLPAHGGMGQQQPPFYQAADQPHTVHLSSSGPKWASMTLQISPPCVPCLHLKGRQTAHVFPLSAGLSSISADLRGMNTGRHVNMGCCGTGYRCVCPTCSPALLAPPAQA